MTREARFLELFRSNPESFVVRKSVANERDEKGKLRAEYVTVKRAVSLADVREHFAGRKCIVAKPEMPDGRCSWTVLDHDIYGRPEKLAEIRETQSGLGLPLHPFASKSGGLHNAVFFSSPVPCDAARELLRGFAARLGDPEAEIYPKPVAAGKLPFGIALPFFGDPEGFDKFAPVLCDTPPNGFRKPPAGLEELGPSDMRADAPGIALPSGADFEALLKERGLKYRKRDERDGSTSYDYHGLDGQPCLIQGSVHAAQRANARQCRFLLKGGRLSHQCFDSDCQGITEPKTRRALRELGLLEKIVPSPAAGVSAGGELFRRDVANSALFAELNAGEVIWAADQRLWYAWDGRRYLQNNVGEVMRRARATVLYMYEAAVQETDGDKRRAKMAWAIQSESRLEKMLTYAASEKPLEVLRFNDAFDLNPFYFNCANGVLDLRTGELLPHDRRYRITKLSPTTYDPEARCPEFDIWLAMTCGGSKELADYLMRFVGYCLSGLTEEQCFWMFYGPTKTGKSTFIRLLRGLMGDYSATLPEGAVIVSRFSNPEHGLAELAGTRLATLVELREGLRFDESKLKQITGQDRIGASKKYMNFFEFESRAKLAMAVNDKPIVRDTGDAFWNRVKPVPFLNFVKPEKRTPDLDRILLETEGPGILARAARAFRDWRRKDGGGMREPKEVAAATAEYRSEQDTVSQFVEEECERSEMWTVTAKDLYRAFTLWAHVNRRRGVSQKRLGMELERLGFKPGRSVERYWEGLSLIRKPQEPKAPPG